MSLGRAGELLKQKDQTPWQASAAGVSRTGRAIEQWLQSAVPCVHGAQWGCGMASLLLLLPTLCRKQWGGGKNVRGVCVCVCMHAYMILPCTPSLSYPICVKSRQDNCPHPLLQLQGNACAQPAPASTRQTGSPTWILAQKSLIALLLSESLWFLSLTESWEGEDYSPMPSSQLAVLMSLQQLWEAMGHAGRHVNCPKVAGFSQCRQATSPSTKHCMSVLFSPKLI